MNVEAAIIGAIENKEKIVIAYHGGRQPGAVREIGPISYDDMTGKVRARCYSTNVVKSFLIEKIQIDNLDFHQPRTREVPIQSMDFSSLSEMYEHTKDTLEGLGWSVIFNAEDLTLELFERFKNGNLKKTSTISLAYEEWIIESAYNVQLGEFVESKREKQKPWTVRAKKKTTTNFLILGKAANKFLVHAESLAPLK
ncbi:hypothetical protein HC725_06405 [Vibrio sp. S17_S38]|uniref:hypothetical protein n=1 Tax=Vibrio sp. S17_S38 TaxID=2720229 RepID=UPI00168036AD|nr:hypothetical protein [Vibrio sp. S17_S38]MBD1572911.1 hypothetical protein [Vibrio sp. S17_S38]